LGEGKGGNWKNTFTGSDKIRIEKKTQPLKSDNSKQEPGSDSVDRPIIRASRACDPGSNPGRSINQVV
jgi:hypothetical protein